MLCCHSFRTASCISFPRKCCLKVLCILCDLTSHGDIETNWHYCVKWPFTEFSLPLVKRMCCGQLIYTMWKFWIRWNCPCALTEHHTMKVYWGVEVYLHAFSTLALDGKNSKSIICFKSFSPHGEARKNCKLTIILISTPFQCIVSLAKTPTVLNLSNTTSEFHKVNCLELLSCNQYLI
jgi:hypothetical protein